MRLIDHQKQRTQKKKQKSRILALAVGICLIVASVFVFFNIRLKEPEPTVQNGLEVTVDFPEYIEGEFKTFTPEEFQQLYETILYPNVDNLSEAPEITGDSEADARIRSIAESRGYSLRSVPVASIKKADEPRLTAGNDDLLQEKALNSWNDLKKTAENEGIPLKLNSGYRSIESQRELFLNRLRATGATVAAIKTGSADAAVVNVLKQAALPGYSRHHTGYTVDFVCGNGIQSFEVTTCFKWLKADNYLNAKKHGWIPSYPEGVDNQGPEPEAWEYVWVSKQALWKESQNG